MRLAIFRRGPLMVVWWLRAGLKAGAIAGAILAVPSPTLSAGHVARIFAIATTAHAPRSVAISGPVVVWLVQQNNPGNRIPHGDIYGKNILTGRQVAVKAGGTAFGSVAISGSMVVWEDCRHCVAAAGLPGYRNPVLYGRDLRTGHEYQLSRTGAEPADPAISGSLVVWMDDGRIEGKDLSTGRLLRVTNHGGQQIAPSISGHTVVWQDSRNGAWDIYGEDLRSGRHFVVARHTGATDNLQTPATNGQVVVWTDWYADGSIGIDGKNLTTGRSFHAATIPAGQYNPQFGPALAISGHFIVWEGPGLSTVGLATSIDAEDLTTSATFQVGRASSGLQVPAMSGDIVIWQEPGRETSAITGAVLVP